MSFDELKNSVQAALMRLRMQDSFLLQANTNERTISHKLAEYLQAEFPQFNVDCEYNRHGGDIKKIRKPKPDVEWDDVQGKTIFPDIIVHKRNTDNHNLLVIEIKKSTNRGSRQFDVDKLVVLTKDDYRYQFGLLLEVSLNNENDMFEWYVNGRRVE